MVGEDLLASHEGLCSMELVINKRGELLVEVLLHKTEDRNFDSQWSDWNLNDRNPSVRV
jgi:hypothetical protein